MMINTGEYCIVTSVLVSFSVMSKKEEELKKKREREQSDVDIKNNMVKMAKGKKGTSGQALWKGLEENGKAPGQTRRGY